MAAWLGHIEAALLVGAYVLSLLAVIHALLHKRDPRSALGWTATALFLPVIGGLLYFMFGIGRADSRAAELMRQAASHAQGRREQLVDRDPGMLPSEHLPTRSSRHMASMGQRLTGCTLTGGNDILPLFNGEEAYPAMLEAIARADRKVYLVSYIFTSGTVAGQFEDALISAALRGADVRVLVDGIGRYYSLKSPLSRLARHGIQTATFLPPSLSGGHVSINLRDHRKILICDDIAFTGGMNISDANVDLGQGLGVQDMHFRCSGPIVSRLEGAFLLDWGLATQQYDATPQLHEELCGDTLCRVVLDGLGNNSDLLHDLICGAISAARQRVHIMTPYFLPTHEMLFALRTAALRGVQTQIILPQKNNLPFVHWATFHLLPRLLESGVQIFYQPPPFAHTKLLLVDDYYTLFGSANLDPRSLRLNFELNIEAFDTSLSRNMETFFSRVRSQSREFTARAWEQIPVPQRLRNAACWLFSPYL